MWAKLKSLPNYIADCLGIINVFDFFLIIKLLVFVHILNKPAEKGNVNMTSIYVIVESQNE